MSFGKLQDKFRGSITYDLNHDRFLQLFIQRVVNNLSFKLKMFMQKKRLIFLHLLTLHWQALENTLLAETPRFKT
jgi:hypothetical protein